jgi:hypothetical protein
MKPHYHEYGKPYEWEIYDGWCISYDNDHHYDPLLSLTIIKACGFNTSTRLTDYLVENFNARYQNIDFLKVLVFDNKEDCQQACDWIDAKLILYRLIM